MFEKLFLLVKNNAGAAVIDNPVIAVKDHNAVIIDAASSIIEVLKTQMESGKIKEMIKFFKYSGTYSSAIITSVVNRFANKLNKFYDIEPTAAHGVSSALIPDVLQQLIAQSKSGLEEDFGVGNLLSNLNGNQTDLRPMVNRMMAA